MPVLHQKMKKIIVCFFIVVCFLVIAKYLPFLSREVNVYSPDNQIHIKLYESKKSMWYSVTYQGTPVVLESMLGINENINWKTNLYLGKHETTTEKNEWNPIYGERNIISDNFNQSEIEIIQKGKANKKLILTVRAYNEGIAFRYFFPDNETLNIYEEHTQYSMPAGTMGYFTPAAQAKYNYLPLNNLLGEAERPLVLKLPTGFYVLLTEAEMVNYARTKYIKLSNKDNTLVGALHSPVKVSAPFKTPWRVIMVAEKPSSLIENNYLLLNLNPPCNLENTSWITPGKAMREITLSTAGAKAVVDFAVMRNLQYLHFDAGWYGNENKDESDASFVSLDSQHNRKPDDLNLEEAIVYAKKHNIKVILYVNQRALEKQLDKLLPLYKSWGVDGLKFGFVNVGSQKWTNWLHEAVRKCAQYELVVNIHDEYRPTGFSRTYPNLLTQEGILGNEAFPDATHNVTAPFTRFTQGAADYTICYYTKKYDKTNPSYPSNKFLLKTTSAHQLAMAVVFYSPLQYLYWGDKPLSSKDEPELEFFDNVPTVWDDTKVLHGEIGEYITIARRSGNEWFVGTMTNTDERNLDIALDFLPKGKNFTAHIYYDAPNAETYTKVGIKTLKVNHKTVIKTKLQPSGGQAIWIK